MASLNFGLQKARASLIARLDVDDLCHTERLSRQVQLIQSSSNIVCVGSGHISIDSESNQLHIYQPPGSHEQLVHRLITRRTCFAHSSVLFSRDIALRVGGYRTCMYRAQDTDLWLRLSEVGRLTALTEPLVSIRHHPAQLSSGYGAEEQLLFGWLAVVSYYCRNIQSPDPLDAGDNKLSEFTEFVRCSLEKLGFFQVRSFKSDLKFFLYSKSYLEVVRILLKIMFQCIKYPTLVMYLLAEARTNLFVARHLARDFSSTN